MFAATTNPIDYIVCVLIVLTITIPVCVNMHKENRHNRDMGWSEYRHALITMAKVMRTTK